MEIQKRIHIAIADDHELMRKGIIQFLEDYQYFSIDFDAANGQELIARITEAEIKPDICILDISMPVMNGYETLAAIKKNWPDIKVIMVSMFHNEYTIIRTMKDGANSYLPKDTSPNELKTAILKVYDHGYYYSEEVTKHLSTMLRDDAKKIKITENEIDFLRFCCSDLSYQQIAEAMGLSPRTVDSYRDALFRKLNVKSRSALVMFAIQTGIKVIE